MDTGNDPTGQLPYAMGDAMSTGEKWLIGCGCCSFTFVAGAMLAGLLLWLLGCGR